MTGGTIFGALFFFLLFIAALTSVVSIFEVIIAYITEELSVTRPKAMTLTTLAVVFISILCAFSNTPDSSLTFFGTTLFDWMDKLSANILLPIGGLLIMIFIGFIMKREDVEDELKQGCPSIKNSMIYLTITKYVAPIAIAIVFLYGLGIINF